VERAKYILAIDQGTTNSKALLIGRSGEIVASASRPVRIAFPQPGWVEQDGQELWRSVADAVGDCLAHAEGAEIAAIGISNQRESALVWDRRTGRPAGPCVIWQCRRTAPFCASLAGTSSAALVRGRSGLPIDPLFSASKIRWLLDHIEDGARRAEAGELCAGTVDSWILWNLTGGASWATDASNASRTQLLNLERVAWDPDLLATFGVPAGVLPEVRSSSEVFGVSVGCGPLPAGIPVASLIGDSHAALFGHAAFAPGAVKATYGTGSSLMTRVDQHVSSAHGLSTTIAWAEAGRTHYALEGNITNTGAAVQWLADLLMLDGGAAGAARLAAGVEDSSGVYLVPAFAGLGAPHWDADARGVLCGLTRGTTLAHVAKATVDSIAYQVRDVFEALRQDSGAPLRELLADGGASRNDRLMQFQADILGCPVVRSSSTDLSAVGAAWLAGLAVGFWRSHEELAALCQPTDRFEPAMPAARREDLIAGWQNALAKARSGSAPAGQALGYVHGSN
jgi:glycerol kinase